MMCDILMFFFLSSEFSCTVLYPVCSALPVPCFCLHLAALFLHLVGNLTPNTLQSIKNFSKHTFKPILK